MTSESQMEPDFQQPPGQPYLQASAADRDAAIDIIALGLKQGRLSQAEHDERLAQALTARTQPELNVLTSDLVVIQDSHHADELAVRGNSAVAPTSYSTNQVSAIMSTRDRRGSWLVPPYLSVSSIMGTVKIDLRQATFESLELTLGISCIMGEIKLWVPPGTEVIDETRMVMADIKMKKLSPPLAGSPRITLTGLVLMGEVVVYGSDHITLGDRVRGDF